MGCLPSKQTREAILKSRRIDNALQSEADSCKHVNILLLGAGESGKSTFMKQMRIIHLSGYSREERQKYIAVVHNNAVQSLVTILKGMTSHNMSFQKTERKADMECFLGRVALQDELVVTADLSDVMARLWKDARVQQCFRGAISCQLNDSAEYFLNALERISSPDYVPLEQDILRTRVKTTGIHEVLFRHQGLTFKIYDVGGQRSERRKWIHCFDDVTAIIFMVAMSEYDLALAEDGHTNRMRESMSLFAAICNNQWFRQTCVVLFLNKRDLFLRKISHSPLAIAFPEYTDANNFEECSLYIRRKFEGLNCQEGRQVYSHFTCATDTESTRFLFLSVTDVIMTNNLKDCGLF